MPTCYSMPTFYVYTFKNGGVKQDIFGPTPIDIQALGNDLVSVLRICGELLESLCLQGLSEPVWKSLPEAEIVSTHGCEWHE